MVYSERVGRGARVVLVHGAMTTSRQTWEKQLELAERWTLLLVTRRGFEPNPPADTCDFEKDGHDIAGLLESGDHIVGHSYGGLGSMFAAAAEPGRVRSLTLAETPLLSLVRGHPAVEEEVGIHQQRLRDATDSRDFYIDFVRRVGGRGESVPQPLPPALERLVRLLMIERPPWEALVPDALLAAKFPVLLVTGGWSPGIDAGADALAAALGARAHRVVLEGRGHVVQRLGGPFNDALEQFLRHAESRTVDHRAPAP